MSKEAVDRLRERAQNEQAAIGLSELCRLQHAEIQKLEKQNAELLTAIQQAYGYLWYVNAGAGAPAEIARASVSVTPEQAAYKARYVLRDLLTHEQRGVGINSVREALTAALHPSTQEVSNDG